MYRTEAANPVLGKYHGGSEKSVPMSFHLFDILTDSLRQDHDISDTGYVVYYQTDRCFVCGVQALLVICFSSK